MSEAAKQLQTTESTPMPIVTGVPSNPLELLNNAVARGVDTDTLRELIALKKEWESDEARKAFYKAVADFKKNPPKVIKDMINKQYGSRYASKGNMVNTVNSELCKYGLSADWDFEQSDNSISVICTLSHEFGHSKAVKLSGPPDTSGSKNPLQQIKSTVTYLEIATFEAVTGIAALNADDDGNGATPKEPVISENQLADLTAKLEELPEKKREEARKAAFIWLKISDWSEVPAAKYADVIKAIEARLKK